MLTAPVVRSILWMCPASSWRRNTRCCCLALACIAERSQVRSIRVRAWSQPDGCHAVSLGDSKWLHRGDRCCPVSRRAGAAGSRAGVDGLIRNTLAPCRELRQPLLATASQAAACGCHVRHEDHPANVADTATAAQQQPLVLLIVVRATNHDCTHIATIGQTTLVSSMMTAARPQAHVQAPIPRPAANTALNAWLSSERQATRLYRVSRGQTNGLRGRTWTYRPAPQIPATTFRSKVQQSCSTASRVSEQHAGRPVATCQTYRTASVVVLVEKSCVATAIVTLTRNVTKSTNGAATGSRVNGPRKTMDDARVTNLRSHQRCTSAMSPDSGDSRSATRKYTGMTRMAATNLHGQTS